MTEAFASSKSTTPALWYFDFISPFSYLQLAKVMQWRKRIDITPVPIAFAAVLKHHGQLGPAEIPGKREFSYRFLQWQAEASGVTLKFPPAHPFNPLLALRLCIAAGTRWTAVQTIFDHIWRDGNAATTADDLAAVAHRLGIANVENAANAQNVKDALRANTDGAIAAGIYGVPSLRVGAEIFWGNDASPMIQDWLDHPDRFNGAEYARLAHLPIGVQRPR